LKENLNNHNIAQKREWRSAIGGWFAGFGLGGLGQALLNILRITLLSGSLLSLGFINLPIKIHLGAIFLTAFALILTLIIEKKGSRFRLWSIYLVSFFLFVHLRSFADESIIPVLFEYVIKIEKILCFGTIPTQWLQEKLYAGQTNSVVWFSIAVWSTYFLVPHLTILASLKLKGENAGRYVTAYIIAYYMGLLIYYALPTAPPWAAAERGYINGCLRILSELGTWIHYDAYFIIYRLIGQPNLFAAMPSVHMAITCIVAFIAHESKLMLLKIAGILYCVAMAFSLVFLGEHYVADILAGVVVGCVSWSISKRFNRVHQDPRAIPPRSSNSKGSRERGTERSQR